MNHYLFLYSLPKHNRRKFEYVEKHLSLAELDEKADPLLVVDE